MGESPAPIFKAVVDSRHVSFNSSSLYITQATHLHGEIGCPTFQRVRYQKERFSGYGETGRRQLREPLATHVAAAYSPFAAADLTMYVGLTVLLGESLNQRRIATSNPEELV